MIVFLMQETIEKTYSTTYEEQFFLLLLLDNKVYIFGSTEASIKPKFIQECISFSSLDHTMKLLYAYI
jgi:hypothetical protein